MRTKIINRSVGHTMPGNAARAYAGKAVRTSKVVTSPGKTKTVTYGPINYYGKQTKTKTKTRY